MSGSAPWHPSEAGFQQAVIELARLCGWLVMHTRPARTEHGWVTPITGDPGFPDLVLAHPSGDVLVLEFKAEAGRVLPSQERWIDALVGAGVDALIVRPSDLRYITARLQHPHRASFRVGS